MDDSPLQPADASRYELKSRWPENAHGLLDRLEQQGVRRTHLGEALAEPRFRAASLMPGPPLHGLDVETQLGFEWTEHDARDEGWFPQGATSSALASPDGRWDGQEILVVSWYSKQGQGARVSIAALVGGEIRAYEHILLVEPKLAWLGTRVSLYPVRVHAGGIEWCGPYLYVADTIRGLRAFDMREVLEVSAPTGGLKAPLAGRLAEAGCRWAVPQVGAYALPLPGMLTGPRFSFLGTSQAAEAGGTSTSALLSGEYRSGRGGARLVEWPLARDGSGRLAADASGAVRAERAWTTQRTNLQGVLALGDRMLLASSAGQGPGRLSAHHASGGGTGVERPWAVGPEDLAYLPDRGIVLSATEHPQGPECETCGRAVFGVSAGDLID